MAGTHDNLQRVNVPDERQGHSDRRNTTEYDSVEACQMMYLEGGKVSYFFLSAHSTKSRWQNLKFKCIL